MIVCGAKFGRIVSLAYQWPYFEAMRTISAIVFGVMDVLLAVVYPEVVKSGFRCFKDDDVRATGNVEKIVSPLAHSAVLIIVSVALGPLFSSIKTFFPYEVTA